jgi:hypothetical protein
MLGSHDQRQVEFATSIERLRDIVDRSLAMSWFAG